MIEYGKEQKDETLKMLCLEMNDDQVKCLPNPDNFNESSASGN